MRITAEVEEVAAKPPMWLIERLLMSWKGSSGDDGILVLAPSSVARRTFLRHLIEMNHGAPIDPTSVLTIGGLIHRLSLDFDLLISDHSSTIDEAIQRHISSKTGDQMDLSWSRSHTFQIMQLLDACIRHDAEIPDEWQSITSEISSQRMRIEEVTGLVHPIDAISRIINYLRSDDPPFSLKIISGIVMLPHSPDLLGESIKLLDEISHHLPIHQILHHGSMVLGTSGWVHPNSEIIGEGQDRPQWLGGQVNFHPQNLLTPILIQVPTPHSEIEAAISAAVTHIEGGGGEVTFVDPLAHNRSDIWESSLRGAHMLIDESRPNINRAINCLKDLFFLAHAPDAWSARRLSAFASQSIFTIDWSKICDNAASLDADLIMKLGASGHMIGGPGEISRWVNRLSHPISSSRDDSEARSKTQHALIQLGRVLYPFLHPEDKIFLTPLLHQWPLPQTPRESLDQLFMIVKVPPDTFASLESIREHLDKARSIDEIVGNEILIDPEQWLFRFEYLIPPPPSSLPVMTPSEAVGLKTDLTIVVGLSSQAWPIHPPSIPLVDTNLMHRFGFPGPERTLSGHRFYFSSLATSGENVILIDPTGCPHTYPCFPLHEQYDAIKSSKSPLPATFSASSAFPKNEESLIHYRVWGEGEYPNPMGFDEAHQRQRTGLSLRGEGPVIGSIIDPLAASIGFDAEIIHNRSGHRSRDPEIDGIFLHPNRHSEIIGLDNIHLSPRINSAQHHLLEGRIFGGNSQYRVSGISADGKEGASKDPRPLDPNPTGFKAHDLRQGPSFHPPYPKYWSSSRLDLWAECPRRAWLETVLGARQKENVSEIISPREVGILVHDVWANYLSDQLHVKVGNSRTTFDPPSLSEVALARGTTIEEMQGELVHRLFTRAPWLIRQDASASTARMNLIGPLTNDVSSLIEKSSPLPPLGMLGTLLKSELRLGKHAILGLEIRISGKEMKWMDGFSIPFKGIIDRVDIIPNNHGSFINHGAPKEIVPLHIPVHLVNARRWIIIRDTKLVWSEKRTRNGERHKRSIHQSLQLAAYARAWECSHPGDIVVGVGITEISTQSDHHLTHSLDAIDSIADLGMPYTGHFDTLHAPSDKLTDSFRLWLSDRVKTALNITDAASDGRIIPTPSKQVCRFCRVSDACDLYPLFTQGVDIWN